MKCNSMQCSIVCGIFKIFKTSFMTIKCRNCVHEQVRNVCLSTDFSQKQKRKKKLCKLATGRMSNLKSYEPIMDFSRSFFSHRQFVAMQNGWQVKAIKAVLRFFFVCFCLFFVCPFGHLKFDCFGPSIFTRVLKIDWHSIGN